MAVDRHLAEGEPEARRTGRPPVNRQVGRISDGNVKGFREFGDCQNGRTMTITTMTTINSVGTSLAMR